MESESDDKPNTAVIMGAVVAVLMACAIVAGVLLMIAGLVAL